jgi:hypothetical protein
MNTMIGRLVESFENAAVRTSSRTHGTHRPSRRRVVRVNKHRLLRCTMSRVNSAIAPLYAQDRTNAGRVAVTQVHGPW